MSGSGDKVAQELIDGAMRTGYMNKLGGKIKISWQSRYFILRDAKLYYCKSPQDPEPCKWIDLKTYSIGPAEKQTNKKFCIGLFNPNAKTYYIQATDQKDMEEWLAALQQRESDNIGIYDFDLLAVIGKGSFGKVMLVRKKGTEDYYAMKVLRKDAMVQKNQVKNTMSERAILQKVQHPFLVGLRYAFLTDDKLYMVLDYVNGGELFFHLQKEGKFSESRAKMYAAEIMLGLEHLHRMDIIYRDLKPENILLDKDGHVRLTDFGLAKGSMSTFDKTNTFCGTPEYLAPEILKEEGHGKAVDWWSLGTLLYEMMAGLPPFYSQNVNVMYEQILSGQLKFPKSMSEEAKDLLTKLLDRSPETRLGSSERDADEIKEHPFFADLDFDKIFMKTYEMEFIPEVKRPDDVSNFDSVFTGEKAVDSVVEKSALSDADRAHTQEKFEGFDFHGEVKEGN